MERLITMLAGVKPRVEEESPTRTERALRRACVVVVLPWNACAKNQMSRVRDVICEIESVARYE